MIKELLCKKECKPIRFASQFLGKPKGLHSFGQILPKKEGCLLFAIGSCNNPGTL